jgi:undecaprenyl-diphosphatase
MTGPARIFRLSHWLSRHIELGLAVLLSLSAGFLWLFAAVADEVIEGDTHAFDEALLLSLRVPGIRPIPLGRRGWRNSRAMSQPWAGSAC